MKTEHTSLPAVHLDGHEALPPRREWTVYVSREEREVLREAIQRIAEAGAGAPIALQPDERRVVLEALEIIGLLAVEEPG